MSPPCNYENNITVIINIDNFIRGDIQLGKSAPYYLGPYWGKPMRYSTGRDHLGMQATSVAMYSILLPGITNQTERLRYYSLYPWLIDQYAINIGSTSIDDFRNFIRRAELLYAYAALIGDNNQKSIAGSLFVKRELKNSGHAKPTDIIDLEEGSEKYWQLKGGAFAQYYRGPLIDIGILTRVRQHSIPVVTDTGKESNVLLKQLLGVDSPAKGNSNNFRKET